MQNSKYDFLFKAVVIGNTKVGKSSLLLRTSDAKFNQSYMPTIGVDFNIKIIEQNGSTAKLQMWDTSGQARFRNLITNYYNGAHGILFVFDVCDPQSFADVKNWINDAEKVIDQRVVKILVGNKCDMQTERVVTKEEADNFANSQGMAYFETSAKDATNVESLFKAFAGEIKTRFGQEYLQKEEVKKNTQVTLDPKQIFNKQKKRTMW